MTPLTVAVPGRRWTARHLITVLSAVLLLNTVVLRVPSAHAITYGFKTRAASVQFTGGWSIECAAWWDDAAFSRIVVTQVTISECYAPDPYGLEAPAVTAYGDAAATGYAAVDAPRSTLTVCIHAIYYYLRPTPAGVAPGTHDSGLVCTDEDAYSARVE